MCREPRPLKMPSRPCPHDSAVLGSPVLPPRATTVRCRRARNGSGDAISPIERQCGGSGLHTLSEPRPAQHEISAPERRKPSHREPHRTRAWINVHRSLAWSTHRKRANADTPPEILIRRDLGSRYMPGWAKPESLPYSATPPIVFVESPRRMGKT